MRRRRNEILDAYLRDIGRFPLLGAEEERRLARVMRDPGRPREERLAARNRLVECNLRLVVSLAKRMTGCVLPFEDRIAIGNRYLVRVVERFDPDRGLRFSTYCQSALPGSIAREANEVGHRIRVPEERRRGLLATADDYGAAANWVMAAEFVGSDSPELSELATPGEDVAGAMDRATEIDRLHAAVRSLGGREASVLIRRRGLFGEREQTLAEIGRAEGVSKERIRQIEDKAERKVRKAMAG